MCQLRCPRSCELPVARHHAHHDHPLPRAQVPLRCGMPPLPAREWLVQNSVPASVSPVPTVCVDTSCASQEVVGEAPSILGGLLGSKVMATAIPTCNMTLVFSIGLMRVVKSLRLNLEPEFSTTSVVPARGMSYRSSEQPLQRRVKDGASSAKAAHQIALWNSCWCRNLRIGSWPIEGCMRGRLAATYSL